MAMTSASRLDSVIADFEAAWRSGSQPRAEGWLDRLDASRPSEATELIYHEFCLAEADGLAPRVDDYLERFPDRRDSLSRLFELHSLTSGGGLVLDEQVPNLPSVGDEIGPYRLRRLMGKGSFAGVYLAEQTDLAGRYVVVKITTRPSPEPELLARVSHAHIVSIIRHGETPDGSLQLIFMPFLGGATLLAVAGETRRIGRRPRSGRDLLERLDRVSAREYPSADVMRPAREILGRLPYAKAMAYMFARLAEALDHAYRCGVAHGDVKPSNILVTADGLPMLFDFNLSIDCLDARSGLGGGTLAYMPPERLHALDRARSPGNGPDEPVDLHRADLYALGLVLIEALTGVSPFVAPGPPGAIAVSREISLSVFPDWKRLPIPEALRPILAQCLASDPTERYATGRALAADLDRWRSDLPPLSAPDAGPTARLGRWVSRRRVVVAAGVLTMITALGAGMVLSRKFQSTIRDRANERYNQFLDTDDLSLFGFRQFATWAKPLTDDAEMARRKLNAYGVVEDPRWRERDDVRTLSEPDRADLELLMLEQVYRLAASYAERTDSADDWRRALDLVERESRMVPASPLKRLQSRLREKLDLGRAPDDARETAPPDWVEFYLLGVEAEPVHARAFPHYEHAIDARPDLLWPRYRDAVAAFRVGQFQEAVTNLHAAAELRPRNPAIHTHLATALYRLDRLDEATAECDLASALDPDFALAFYDRSLIDSQLSPGSKHVDRSIKLMRTSTRAAAERLTIQSLFTRSLRNAEDPGDGSDVDSLLSKITRADPSDPEIKVQLALRIARSGRRAEAITALDDILSDHPEHLRARYNRALILRRLGRPEAAAEASALIDNPRFEELYTEQPEAIQLFHHATNDRLVQRRFADALALAERGLAESLRTRLHTAESYYALARVRATAGAADPDQLDRARAEVERSVDFDGRMANWYRNDQLFSSLRKADPTFLSATPRP
jgi:serine/threonine protein kinase/Flp pilus assembly protein TadD